jgi:hypothetical protein
VTLLSWFQGGELYGNHAKLKAFGAKYARRFAVLGW